MSKFGFELLHDQTLMAVASDMSLTRAAAVGDSEIEKLLWCALVAEVLYDNTAFKGISTPTDAGHCERLKKILSGQFYLILQAQVQREGWRVDFVLSVEAWENDGWVWKDAIIECDGHDFHERTKKQASRDRKRDRKATASKTPIFRFTGSELWRDPKGCAAEIIDWAQGVVSE
jgi:very-short-patch-repair endonuclease